MKNIMFNDRYGLTQAVLEGRKTTTRRIYKYPITCDGITVSGFRKSTNCESDYFTHLISEDEIEIEGLCIKQKYEIGEKVAIAQSYLDINNPQFDSKGHDIIGNTNKMFVRSDLMPHQIQITNVKIERLQDISDEDCMKEGIEDIAMSPDDHLEYGFIDNKKGYYLLYDSPRKAYNFLINKICGNFTCEKNPYILVYEFKLIK